MDFQQILCTRENNALIAHKLYFPITTFKLYMLVYESLSLSLTLSLRICEMMTRLRNLMNNKKQKEIKLEQNEKRSNEFN